MDMNNSILGLGSIYVHFKLYVNLKVLQKLYLDPTLNFCSFKVRFELYVNIKDQ